MGVPFDLTSQLLMRVNGPVIAGPRNMLKPMLSTSDAVDHVSNTLLSMPVALKDVSVTSVASSTAAENSEKLYTSPHTKLLFTSNVTVRSLKAPPSTCSHLNPLSPP